MDEFDKGLQMIQDGARMAMRNIPERYRGSRSERLLQSLLSRLPEQIDDIKVHIEDVHRGRTDKSDTVPGDRQIIIPD